MGATGGREIDPRNKPLSKSGERLLQSLARRLEADNLNTDDRQRLELTKRIREHRKQGKTLKETALAIGETIQKVEKFTQRGVYRFFYGYLESLEKGEDEKSAEALVRQAKLEMAAFAPDAMEFYRECFKRNHPEVQEEKGLFADEGKAQWATEKVTRALGLAEPTHVSRPVVNIAIGLIQAENAHLQEDDDAARAALAVDVTPSNDEDKTTQAQP